MNTENDDLQKLALAVEVVIEAMTDLGDHDDQIDTTPETIYALRRLGAEYVTDEMRESQDGIAFLTVLEATDADLHAAYAVLAEKAEQEQAEEYATYRHAVALVIADVRESYPELDEDQALAHVRDTMRLPEDPAVAGAYPLEEDGSVLAAAYRIILTDLTADEPEPVIDSTYRHTDDTMLNSVAGLIVTSATEEQIRADIAPYEQEWIEFFPPVGPSLVPFLYSSEDSTDLVGMLAYLREIGDEIRITRFAFGTDRIEPKELWK